MKFYARVQDSTLLKTLSTLSTEQIKDIEYTKTKINQLFDYCVTHPNTKIQFYTSDIILHIHSDKLYLSEPNSCSAATEYFCLAYKPDTKKNILNNGAIHTLVKIIKYIILSATECELGILFINIKNSLSLNNIRETQSFPAPRRHSYPDQ